MAKVDTFDQCQMIGPCVGDGEPLQGGARPFHATNSCRRSHCTTRVGAWGGVLAQSSPSDRLVGPHADLEATTPRTLAVLSGLLCQEHPPDHTLRPRAAPTRARV